MVRWKIKEDKPKHGFSAAVRVEAYGLKFESQLEKYAYDVFTEIGIPFEFQKKYLLQEPFKNPSGNTIKRITLKVDFVTENNGKIYFIDTKGRFTEVSKIKYKILSYNHRKQNHEVVILKSKAKVKNYAVYLKSLFNKSKSK